MSKQQQAQTAETQNFLHFSVGGMDCPSCGSTVKKAVERLSGVTEVQANYMTMRLKVYGDVSQELQDRILRQVSSIGYKPRSLDSDAGAEAPETGSQVNWEMITMAASGVLIAAAAVLWLGAGWRSIAIPLLLASMPLSGWNVFRKGIAGFVNRSLDMNSLMTLAATGALFIGEYFEGALVLFLGSVAETLESWSTSRAQAAVQKLMDLTPAKAVVRRSGVDYEINPAEIHEGETVVIRPGARVPLDGEIIEGASELDQSAITGESMPVAVETGGNITAGSVNGSGALLIKVTATLENSTVSRIARMVEDAQQSRSKTERFIDRFASIYTPAAILLALLVAVIPPLLFGGWSEWLYRALAMLLIACPCALIISTPTAVVAGLAAAARSGILVRGGEFLEQGKEITRVVFDKTGTLTQGKLSVGDIYSAPGFEENRILAVAAALEASSEHPIAGAVLRAAEQRAVSFPASREIAAHPGKGITGTIDGTPVRIGTREFVLDLQGINESDIANLTRQAAESKSLIFIAIDNALAGALTLTDEARGEASEAISKIRELTEDRITILSGDDSSVVAALAAKLDIPGYHGRLLPEEKLEHLRQFKRQGEKILMVGDGINDSPALSLADVGVAMGSTGADVALESAGVALVGDDLRKVPYFMRLSRRVIAIISQNIVLSLGLKAVFLILAALGHVSLWMAVLADTGLSLLVTANSLRLLGAKRSFQHAD